VSEKIEEIKQPLVELWHLSENSIFAFPRFVRQSRSTSHLRWQSKATSDCLLYYRQHCAQRKAPVFKLFRPILRFFAPQGRHVPPMGVKFDMEGIEIGWRGTKVPSSMPNFTPIGGTIRV